VFISKVQRERERERERIVGRWWKGDLVGGKTVELKRKNPWRERCRRKKGMGGGDGLKRCKKRRGTRGRWTLI